MKHLSKSLMIIILLSLFLFPSLPCRNSNGIVMKIDADEVQDEETAEYSILYRFCIADSDGTIELPDELVKLLPETQNARDGERVEPAELAEYATDEFRFLGWEPPYAEVNGEDVIFSGIWKANNLEKFMNKGEILRAATTLYSGFGSLAWGLREPSYIGTYNFLLGGRQAYCIEMDYSVPPAGTLYTYERQDSSKIARIIGKGTLNGMSPGAIQATVWNYAVRDKNRAWVTTGESVDYDDPRYSGGNCTISVYTPSGSYQRFALLEGCEEPTPEPQPGYLMILKEAEDEYGLAYLGDAYSLAGAVYGVYNDAACSDLKTTLTTDENGRTERIQLDIGTYYVKEITPSSGFELDEQIHTVTIPDSGNITITSIEVPQMGEVFLNKKAEESPLDYQAMFPKSYTLKDAKYGIYADEGCTQLITTLLIDVQGNTPTVKLPEGTYYLKEITPSKGYMLDENVYPVNIQINETVSVTSIERPLNALFKVSLVKTNLEDVSDIAYLEETEFTLKYYDTSADDLSGMEPLFTWVFRPLIKEGKAQILFDKEHYVKGDPLLLDENGNFFLPIGTFTLRESKPPQTYILDENIYIGHVVSENGTARIIFIDGEWMHQDINLLASVNDDELILNLTQQERKAIISTTAVFEESGDDRYIADGIAHINDLVRYDYLIPGKEYILKARLICKDNNATVCENEITFTPAAQSGEVSISLTTELDDYGGCDLVAYEYLYLKEEPDKLIVKHEDINDEGQTVHAESLYKASMVLYKIGGSRDIRLNGAVFSITTRRVRNNGEVIEKDLGKFVSGGIYVEQQEPFEFEVAADREMTQGLRTYSSFVNPYFGLQHVCITDLPEGVYYGRIKGGQLKQYRIEQGMILLENIPADTQITYTELIAPKGYFLNGDPFTIDVGHDETLTRIDNYRTNRAIVIPKTGI